MAKTKLHLAEVATNPNIAALPLDKTVYVTVRAYNKAGELNNMHIFIHNVIIE